VSSGHAGGTRPGQTRKKPKDLGTREGEERGRCRGGGGGVYGMVLYDETMKRELNK
jgi:hypothetical protein